MATITKRDLIVAIADKLGFTQNQIANILQHFLDDVTSHLARNDAVVLRKFGTFEIRVTKPKIGRNPNEPGTDVRIPPRAIVKFKPGKEMKERVAQLLPTLVTGKND